MVEAIQLARLFGGTEITLEARLGFELRENVERVHFAWGNSQRMRKGSLPSAKVRVNKALISFVIYNRSERGCSLPHYT